MEKKSLGVFNTYTEQPDRGPCIMYDMYKPLYRQYTKNNINIDKIPKGGPVIRGVVPKDALPKDGGGFSMFYHSIDNTAVFGAFTLDECQNVIENKGYYYFEDGSGRHMYVLAPCILN